MDFIVGDAFCADFYENKQAQKMDLNKLTISESGQIPKDNSSTITQVSLENK